MPWQARLAGGVTRIFSHTGTDFTRRFPNLATERATLPDGTVMDGEVVATAADGRHDFVRLHLNRDALLTFWGFDLLRHNHADVRPQALSERRAHLKHLISRLDRAAIAYSESFDDPDALLAACEPKGLEGVVIKRQNEPYRSGPWRGWIKVECPSWKATHAQRHRLFR